MSLKVGIVVDNYKVDKFKEKLSEGGLIVLSETVDNFRKITVIKILCEKFQLDQVRTICTVLQINFNQGN